VPPAVPPLLPEQRRIDLRSTDSQPYLTTGGKHSLSVSMMTSTAGT
jgi:hypothetical protein